jgi:carbonic anhydrase
VSLANLMTFPWIAARVAEGRLKLHGAWFAIRTGELMVMDETGEFTAAA